MLLEVLYQVVAVVVSDHGLSSSEQSGTCAELAAITKNDSSSAAKPDSLSSMMSDAQNTTGSAAGGTFAHLHIARKGAPMIASMTPVLKLP